MALGGTDLNLLLPLKVLLEEGNVTRAGQRLELSQPAMSAALARLRRRFDDELLVRAGRDYELTPFARDLLPEVQHAVRLMGPALHLEDEFDPATSRAHVPADDERLRDRGGARAAGAADAARPRPASASASSTSARTSAVLGPRAARLRRPDRAARLRLPGRVPAAVAGPDGADRRPRQPAPGDGGLTLEDLAELPHAVAELRARRPDPGRPGLRRARHRPPDRAAGRPASCRCRSSSRAPSMVAVVPEKLARIHPRADGPVVQVEPPFDEVVLAEGYWFARDRLSDPAHRWLFARLDELAARDRGRRRS